MQINKRNLNYLKDLILISKILKKIIKNKLPEKNKTLQKQNQKKLNNKKIKFFLF